MRDLSSNRIDLWNATRVAQVLCGLSLLAAATCGCSSSQLQRPTAPPFVESGDLDDIRQHGVLRVLVPLPEQGSRLPRGDSPLDDERELAEAFARQQGLEPFWVWVKSRSDLIPFLLEGKGDLVAANLTATPERRREVAFSVPLSHVREQIVTRSGDLTIDEPADLVGRTVALRRSSSFWNTVERLRESYPGIKLREVPEYLDTDEIVHRVATRRYDVTVADSNVVESILRYRDDVRVACDLTDERPIGWAVRPESHSLLSGLNLFLAEAQLARRRDRPFHGDWPEIRQRRVLRVLTRNSPATYFLWRGKLMGFDYELSRRFTRENDLRLEVVVPQRNEKLLTMLLEGKGDVIAAAMTPTTESTRQGVAFSVPYNYVSRVVVARAGEPVLPDLESLAGRTLFVRNNSGYWEDLLPLRDLYGFRLEAAPDYLNTEEIIGLVADGAYDLTVADSHVLDIELTWRDDVDAAFALGDPVPVSWVVRKSNPQLLETIDRFLSHEYRGLFYNVIYNKYFKDPKKMRRHQEYRTGNGALSPYDGLVRPLAEAHGFDWRLIVAQIYQESEFDPGARSFAGAVGLLQVLPRTAEQMGHSNLEDPGTNIEAGVRYLDWVRERFEDDLPYWERMWFALAAYNAGHGHVSDARRLARQKGWNPDVWFDNVERAMLLLSHPEYAREAPHGYCRGSEPVRYVREIRSRYEAYLTTMAPRPETPPAHHAAL